MGFYQSLLILLLILPVAAAIVVACLGAGRALLVRQVALGATVAGVIVSLVIAAGFLYNRGEMHDSTYRPEFVPGASAADPSRTTWTLIDLNLGRAAKADK